MSILCQSIECLPNTCGVFVDETSFSFADNRTTVVQCSKLLMTIKEAQNFR